MQTRHPTHPHELASLPSPALRERFLVEDLFVNEEIRLVHSHHDRVVIGGAVPAGRTLDLPVPAELRAGHFCDRRELAVVCLAGTGTVTVCRRSLRGSQAHSSLTLDDAKYPMTAGDVLYVGQGSGEVRFDGEDARYYLFSAPAHEAYPTTLARRPEVSRVDLGDQAHANVRTIRKYIHAAGVRSCQVVLGITELAEGSVWNTMPCHTHDRRTEVYLYFGLGAGERVLHLCGRPDATRSIVVANEQAVISPSWSVHCGAGTANYSFVWAMAGENIAFDDMDLVPTEELR